MGIFDAFKQKKTRLLKPEDEQELMEIKRQAYMEEARKIMKEKGMNEAKLDLLPKKPNSGFS